MQNFNTNQTRHFYVVGSDATSAGVTEASNNGACALGKTATGEVFFKIKNYDGLLTRTDTISPEKVVSVKLATTGAASGNFKSMDMPIKAYKLVVDSGAVTIGSTLVGKTLTCKVTVHELFDYDEANSLTVVASIVGDSTNTASADAFYKALAIEIAKALPKSGDTAYPYFKVYVKGTNVTRATKVSDLSSLSSIAGIYIVPGLQKHVRGKLTGEPCTLSVASSTAEYANGAKVGDMPWLTVTSGTVAAFNTADSVSMTPTVVPGVYKLADLEHFALGERGDMYRGWLYPNDRDITYKIDDSKNYHVLSIEYYWSGNAENIQKSPRLLEIVAEKADSDDVIESLYAKFDAAIHPVNALIDDLDARVEALEA